MSSKEGFHCTRAHAHTNAHTYTALTSVPLSSEPDGRQPSGKAPPVMVTHGKKSPRVKKKGGEDKEKRYSNEYKLTPESSRRQFGAVAWSDEARLRSATPDNDTPESKRCVCVCGGGRGG